MLISDSLGLPLQAAEVLEHESAQTTWALQDFSTLPTKREWVAYQHLKWDAMIASPGPVIFECDSAAEIQEVFQFTGGLGRFLFHVDIRIKLFFEKSEVLC